MALIDHNLYHNEFVIFINTEEIKNADENEVKKFMEREKNFLKKFKGHLDLSACPYIASTKVMYGYSSSDIKYSNIIKDCPEINQLMQKGNTRTVFFSNISLPDKNKEFLFRTERFIKKIDKNLLNKYAKKFNMKGEYRSRAYITERRSKGFLKELETIGVQGQTLHQGEFG